MINASKEKSVLKVQSALEEGKSTEEIVNLDELDPFIIDY